MAKTQAKTTASPAKYALGQPILSESTGLLEVSQALNWVYGYRPEQHLGLTLAQDGWDGSSLAPGTLRCEVTTALATFIDTDLWLSPEAALADLELSAECAVGGGDVVTVSWVLTGSLGSTTATVTCSAAHNLTERTTTAALSGVTAGGEWVRLVVKAQTTTGTGSHELVEVVVEEATQTSLPDPNND